MQEPSQCKSSICRDRDIKSNLKYITYAAILEEVVNNIAYF